MNHPFLIIAQPFPKAFITILKLREKCFTTRWEFCFFICEFLCYVFTLCPGMSTINFTFLYPTINNVIQGNGSIVLAPFSLKFLLQLIIFPVVLA